MESSGRTKPSKGLMGISCLKNMETIFKNSDKLFNLVICVSQNCKSCHLSLIQKFVASPLIESELCARIRYILIGFNACLKAGLHLNAE